MQTINARYKRKATNEDGRTEITLELQSSLDAEVASGLEKDTLYRLGITPIKTRRSVDQNRLMWALIDEIAEARGDSTSDGKWEVYLEALEQAQASYFYIQAVEEAVKDVKEAFRTVREINRFVNEKGNTIVALQCFKGSSKMDKAEMAKLLEVVIEMAAAYDIRPLYE